MHLADLWPFPAEAVAAVLGAGTRFIVVEQNCTAQLGALIRQQTGCACADSVLRYDGRPLTAADITRAMASRTP